VYSKSENGECVIICLYVDDMFVSFEMVNLAKKGGGVELAL